MKMGCVVREPLHCLAAQPRDTAIFEGEPSLLINGQLKSLPSITKGFTLKVMDGYAEFPTLFSITGIYPSFSCGCYSGPVS